MYNFLAITRLRSLLEPGSLTVELCNKFCVDPYPKHDFHEKSQVVDFSIAGHICYNALLQDHGHAFYIINTLYSLLYHGMTSSWLQGLLFHSPVYNTL